MLEHVRAETVDRYGALPAEVETLFAVASLRGERRRARSGGDAPRTGAGRGRPVVLPEELAVDLGSGCRAPRSTTRRGRSNLVPGRIFGLELGGGWSRPQE